MSESGEPKSEADRTLLGVAPPRFESAAEAPRSPVLVRAGDSIADTETAVRPRVALPSRPPAAAASNAGPTSAESTAERALRLARAYPALWMVGAPTLAALGVVALAVATAPTPVPKPSPIPSPALTLAAPVAPVAPTAPEREALPSLAELEAKPPGTLSAAELLRLAEGKREERRRALEALRDKVTQDPGLLTDKSVQAELLPAARDSQTAPQALAVLAAAPTPLSADLLYEAWAGTSARTDATELSRAVLYSTDVRPHASPALSAALDLRAAETCEQLKAALPHALQNGDRRALSPLGKLVHRRGCGPKKADDCYACLREPKDELTATINAAKSRRAPTFPVP